MKKLITYMLVAVLLLQCTWATAQQNTRAIKEHVLETMASVRNAYPYTAPALDNARSTLNEQVRVPQREVVTSWEEGQWVNEVQNTRTYNSSGFVERVVSREMPANTLVLQQTYTYASPGIPNRLLIEEREGNAWVNAAKYEFDFQGENMNRFEFYGWDDESNDWVLTLGLRTAYTSTGGRVTQSITEVYSLLGGATWIMADRKAYTYTGTDNRPTGIVTSERENNQWVETERETQIAYNGATTERSSYFYEEYDPQSQTWDKYKFEYQYTQDAANQTRTIVETEFDVAPGTNTTTPASRITTTFLTAGERYVPNPTVRELTERYVGNTWQRTDESLGLITRANGDITQIIYQELNNNGTAMENQQRFVYSDFTTLTITSAADKILAEAVQMFPNPVNDKLRISLDATKVRNANLAVYSLTGQKVYEQQTLGATATVDMAQLPKGIYLVKVTGNDNGMLTRKIVKM